MSEREIDLYMEDGLNMSWSEKQKALSRVRKTGRVAIAKGERVGSREVTTMDMVDPNRSFNQSFSSVNATESSADDENWDTWEARQNEALASLRKQKPTKSVATDRLVPTAVSDRLKAMQADIDAFKNQAWLTKNSENGFGGDREKSDLVGAQTTTSNKKTSEPKKKKKKKKSVGPNEKSKTLTKDKKKKSTTDKKKLKKTKKSKRTNVSHPHNCGSDANSNTLNVSDSVCSIRDKPEDENSASGTQTEKMIENDEEVEIREIEIMINDLSMHDREGSIDDFVSSSTFSSTCG